MDPEKIKIIPNWRPPRNIKGIKFFLNLVNYFRRLFQYYGHLRKPLVRLTRQRVPFAFGLKEIEVFEALKTAVAKELILKKWYPELPTKVEINTFNSITGDMLS